jgi:hypothetical protein
MSFVWGEFHPSNGAMIYSHFVHPGGCSSLVGSVEASFGRLTDATHGPDTCKNYNFDDRSPLTSGPGIASACGSDSTGSGYISYDDYDACWGLVLWSPSTFVFSLIGLTAEVYYPTDTCFVSTEVFGLPTEYACEGGSVVYGVMDASQCTWNWNETAELECSCIPKYANKGCPSLLGEPPNSSGITAFNQLLRTNHGAWLVFVMTMAMWQWW